MPHVDKVKKVKSSDKDRRRNPKLDPEKIDLFRQGGGGLFQQDLNKEQKPKKRSRKR